MKIIKFDYTCIYLLLILLLCGYIKIGLYISFIILFHELGHILISLLFKYKIIKVIIYPFGGITYLQKDINTPVKREIILAASGIFMQIILLLLFKDETFTKYNLSIMFFNLLPIIPLDGSIILKAFLNKFFSFKKSYILYIVISIISVFIYTALNYKYNLNNYLIISIFIYRLYKEIKSYKYIYNRFLLERYLKKYNFKYISTKKGNLDILKIDTYQFFKEKESIVSEAKKLQERFDKSRN